MTDGPSKKSAALNSVWASAFLTAIKLVVGLLTGSLGILSEAAHSLLDLGAAGLTYFAVRVSDLPADSRHPFGHGKIESVSALAETALLFLTSAWIIREAVLRLLSPAAEVHVTWYSIAVVVLSMVIDFTRSRALMKVAKATRSQALEADALHFSSDILSSAVVLVGLGCVMIGYAKGDAIAAIGVSLFVLHVGYRLGRRTIEVLIDTAPEGVAAEVERIAATIDGVARVDRVRARPAGTTTFVEILIRVGRSMPLARVQDVCDSLSVAISRQMPGTDPFVKAEPVALDDESIIDTVRVIANKRQVMVHDIVVEVLEGRRHVSFDIEIDETMNIHDAHDVASGVEQVVCEELGEDVHIETHIDPKRVSMLTGQPIAAEMHRRLEAEVVRSAEAIDEVEEAHGVHIRRGEEGLYVSLHCLFAPATPVRVAHRATAIVEQRIREKIPDVGRVVVHAEPLGEG